jgi:hypothetical protein
MKAEQLKAKIRNAIATSIYTGSLGMGMNGYDDATEKCLKIIDEYARIQIEKDRKRILQEYYNGTNTSDFNTMVKNTPIILD